MSQFAPKLFSNLKMLAEAIMSWMWWTIPCSDSFRGWCTFRTIKWCFLYAKHTLTMLLLHSWPSFPIGISNMMSNHIIWEYKFVFACTYYNGVFILAIDIGIKWWHFGDIIYTIIVWEEDTKFSTDWIWEIIIQ